MNIIQLKPNPSNAFPPIQSLESDAPPNGCAIVPDTLDATDFYAHNGFVTLTVEGETVVSMEPNLPAWEAWRASLPPVAPPKPTETERLRADVDYLAVLTGVAL